MSLAFQPDQMLSLPGQIVGFSFGPESRPPIAAVVRVATGFRSAALAAHQVVTGSRDSFLLSGHEPDGVPGRGHRHAFYLPDPDGAGRIRGLYIVSAISRFSKDEIEALRLLRRFSWSGGTGRVSVAAIEEDSSSLRQVASSWETVTAYVPPRRFYGTHGKRHIDPERQLLAELTSLVPGVHEITAFKQSGMRMAVRIAPDDQKRLRRGAASPASVRESFHVRIKSSMPICGPVLLGHSTHFGLGQFRPVLE
jgi:CRISPR-associated protein Csb2